MKNKIAKTIDRIKNGKKEYYTIEVRRGEHKVGIVIRTYNAETAINTVIKEGNYTEILEVKKGIR